MPEVINELTMEACICPGTNIWVRQDVRRHVKRMAAYVSSFLRAPRIC